VTQTATPGAQHDTATDNEQAPEPLRFSRPPQPVQTWPTVLVEGEPDHLQAVALALADDNRVGEVYWIDWTSGLGDQWTAGTRTRIVDRKRPEDWETQLRMIDHIAAHARSYLDRTGKPIAVVIDSATAIYAEQRRWARQQTNNVPKTKHALRQYPGLAVPIDGQVWDEIEDRHIHLMEALNGIPGISVLLATGKLRVVDRDGAALAVPEYRVDTHRLIPLRVHAHLRVDDTGTAYPRRVPPLWRDRLDPTTPATIGELVFDTLELDPLAAQHHTGS
jgi:hypothetical protein